MADFKLIKSEFAKLKKSDLVKILITGKLPIHLLNNTVLKDFFEKDEDEIEKLRSISREIENVSEKNENEFTIEKEEHVKRVEQNENKSQRYNRNVYECINRNFAGVKHLIYHVNDEEEINVFLNTIPTAPSINVVNIENNLFKSMVSCDKNRNLVQDTKNCCTKKCKLMEEDVEKIKAKDISSSTKDYMESMTLLANALPSLNKRKNSRHSSQLQNLQTERLSLGEEAKIEMATLPAKTPVSVLQELLSRRGITPKYELVQIEGAIHEPIFRYRVYLSPELVATGTGRSKKDAKHSAAKNLLDLLVGKLSPEQANQTNGTPGASDITNQVASPYDDKVMGNPIGWLQEMCMSKRWPPPSYEMEHEEGLPHERQFTISCQVLKYREVGTGKSKKLAKRMAAHKMWQSLQDMPPDAALSSADEDELGKLANIEGRYSILKDSKIKKITPQQTHKISQFHKALKQSEGPKLNELQKISLSLKDFDFVEYLMELSREQTFEVTFVDIEEKTLKGRCQCLCQISSLPVAVCYGTGVTPKEAKSKAAHNALEYLKIMTKK